MEKEEKKFNDNNFGLASVILSTISIIFAFGIMLHGMAIAIIALIFGIIQRNKLKNKWSTWGIILSIIGLILNLSVLAFLTLFVAKQLQNPELINQLNQLSQLQNAQYGQ